MKPSQRMSLLDALRPPSGYELAAAVGTSFSFDFGALGAVLLALMGWDPSDDKDEDRAATLVAVTRNRVRVLVNDASPLPDRVVPVVARTFDRVIDVVPVQGGVFHPKVWVARFMRKAGTEGKDRELWRLVCASRNLDAGRMQEAGVVLEGRPAPDAGSASKRKSESPETLLGRDVKAFLEACFAPDASRRSRPVAVQALLDAVGSVAFSTKGLAGDVRLEYQAGLSPGLVSLLREVRGTRALLMAPFLATTFVADLSRRFGDLTVISTQDQFDALPAALRDRVALKVFAAPRADDGRFDSLHAKMLTVEDKGAVRTWIGSANGTLSGWGDRADGLANWEAMLSLDPGVRVGRCLEDLSSLLQPYCARALDSKERDEQLRWEALRRAIAALRLQVSYREADRTLRLEATPESGRVPADASCDVVPLTWLSREDAWKPLSGPLASAEWSGLGARDVTRFFAVRVSELSGAKATRLFLVFGTGLAIEAALDRRDDLLRSEMAMQNPWAFLRRILTGRGRFGGGGGGGGGSGTGIHGGSKKPGGADIPPLELILEACSLDETRVQEVQRWLAPMQEDELDEPDRSQLKEFKALWEIFCRACEKGGRSRGRAAQGKTASGSVPGGGGGVHRKQVGTTGIPLPAGGRGRPRKDRRGRQGAGPS